MAARDLDIPTDGERLLSALRSLDDLTRREGECWTWDDAELLLLFAPLFGVTIQLVTVKPGAWNIHLNDEVLVLDPSGGGDHKLVSPEVWALSAELNESLGLESDGVSGG